MGNNKSATTPPIARYANNSAKNDQPELGRRRLGTEAITIPTMPAGFR
jgi:hypothetical protein